MTCDYKLADKVTQGNRSYNKRGCLFGQPLYYANANLF